MKVRSTRKVILMSRTEAVLSPSEAARQLGVSSKALRLYEEHGLVRPVRNAAGWRHYGPVELARARQVIALRALGLSLREIRAVLGGEGRGLADALTAQQGKLEAELSRLLAAIDRIRDLRHQVERGQVPRMEELASNEPALAFSLPWPWNGERFEMRRLAPVTYLVGSLGSGKTRLALAIADATGGTFVPLERQAPEDMSEAMQRTLEWMRDDGATMSDALVAVVGAMVVDSQTPCVLDLVEYGLDEPTQLALGAWLRRRGAGERPLVVMTRSNVILDLEAVTRGHAIIYCPANHTLPYEVLAIAGTPGLECVAQCLGSVEARARVATPLRSHLTSTTRGA